MKGSILVEIRPITSLLMSPKHGILAVDLLHGFFNLTARYSRIQPISLPPSVRICQPLAWSRLDLGRVCHLGAVLPGSLSVGKRGRLPGGVPRACQERARRRSHGADGENFLRLVGDYSNSLQAAPSRKIR